jgi:hypothetical protein
VSVVGAHMELVVRSRCDLRRQRTFASLLASPCMPLPERRPLGPPAAVLALHTAASQWVMVYLHRFQRQCFAHSFVVA